MKAMILAAGLGTRLLPATRHLPKPCFPILNKPIIAHIIDNLVKAGVNEIVVNLHHLPEMVKEAVEKGRPDGLTVHYSFEKDILGTAGGIKKVQELLMDGPFILHNGDIFFADGLKEAVEFHQGKEAKATMIVKKGEHEAYIGLDDEAKIKRFPYGHLKENEDYSMKTCFTGIHILDPVVFDYIPADTFYCINSDVYPKLLMDGHPSYGYLTDSSWYDIGTPADFLRVNEELLGSGHFLAGQDTTIGTGCKIWPDTVIGNGCSIGNGCEIKESVIFDDVTIGKEVTIKRSIILNGCDISSFDEVEGIILTREERRSI